ARARLAPSRGSGAALFRLIRAGPVWRPGGEGARLDDLLRRNLQDPQAEVWQLFQSESLDAELGQGPSYHASRAVRSRQFPAELGLHEGSDLRGAPSGQLWSGRAWHSIRHFALPTWRSRLAWPVQRLLCVYH